MSNLSIFTWLVQWENTLHYSLIDGVKAAGFTFLQCFCTDPAAHVLDSADQLPLHEVAGG